MCCHRIALTRFALALACAVLFSVRAADAAQCTISTTPLVFGTYNVFTTAPTDSTGTVIYNCNGGGRTILITMTRGGSPTFLPRQMASGPEKFSYNLFRDAARTTVWGDATAGTSAYFEADPPNKTDIVVTIFGRVPPGQDVRAGSYSDTVSIEVNF